MTIAASIARAALPEKFVVCGVSLRPFCIGHWLNMTRFDCSFLNGEAQHTLGDLLIAVLVCSESYESFQDSLLTGDIDRAMERWQFRLSGGWRGLFKRRWKRLRGGMPEPVECLGIDLANSCEEFQRYLDEHGAGLMRVNDWSIPVTKMDEKNAISINGPPYMVLLDAL